MDVKQILLHIQITDLLKTFVIDSDIYEWISTFYKDHDKNSYCLDTANGILEDNSILDKQQGSKYSLTSTIENTFVFSFVQDFTFIFSPGDMESQVNTLITCRKDKALIN